MVHLCRIFSVIEQFLFSHPFLYSLLYVPVQYCYCNKGLTEVNVSQAGACKVDGTLSRAELYEIKRESHGIWHEEQK